MTIREQKKVMKNLAVQQGNITTLALTLGVTVATVWRWQNGVTKLAGTALVAVEAVRDHPEDYSHFLKLVNPQGRPAKKK